MIHLYCREFHKTSANELCLSCRELLTYAKSRLEKCPYAEDKPTCASCPVHCYKPERRRQIQQVMRYAGPRMLRSHPLLALRHLLKKFKKPKV
ncbi:MAG: nitrous oxide-stimulated promoter family protein [Deltaproteobacteria bacterium]